VSEQSEINHSVRITIFGEEYTIRGKVDPALIKRVSDLVDHKMKEVAANTPPHTSEKRIAILAAMNLAGDFLKAREDYQSVVDEVQSKSQLLINEIDTAINSTS